MKFVKKLMKRTKSINSETTSSSRRSSSLKKQPLKRTKSLDADVEKMRAGLEDSIELFPVEEPTIVSAEELQHVIEALAQAKDSSGEGANAGSTTAKTMDEATIKKKIATVKEFWRLINAQNPQAAYALISDDIQDIQQHWDVIYPNIEKPQPSSFGSLSGTSFRSSMARVA